MRLLKGCMRRLHRIGVKPSLLTTIGLSFGLIANFFLWENHSLFVTFFFLYLVFDYIDGALAKSGNISTIWGNGYDEFVDITIAFITMINVGFLIEKQILGLISISLLLYQEWFYGLLHRLNIKKVPLHSYYIAYLFIFFGDYSAGLYGSIIFSISGIFIGLFFFMKSKTTKKKTKRR